MPTKKPSITDDHIRHILLNGQLHKENRTLRKSLARLTALTLDMLTEQLENINKRLERDGEKPSLIIRTDHGDVDASRLERDGEKPSLIIRTDHGDVDASRFEVFKK